MFRISLSLVVLLVLVSALWYSCTNDGIVQPKDPEHISRIERIGVSPGKLHNEILEDYFSRFQGQCLPPEGASYEEGVRKFIAAANTVCEKHGIDMKIDERFIKRTAHEFHKFRDESGYDIFNPSGDFDVAIKLLQKREIVTPEGSDRILSRWEKIRSFSIQHESTLFCDQVRMFPLDNIVASPSPYATDDIAISIMDHSAIFWSTKLEQIALNDPELSGWGDWWRNKRIREWFIIGSDALGALAGAPAGPAGAIIGGALGSIAATIAWPPEYCDD